MASSPHGWTKTNCCAAKPRAWPRGPALGAHGLNPDGAFAIGIKIGRRSADWLLVDFTGHVRERVVLDYAFPDIDVLLPAIRTHLNQLLDGLGPLRSRVVGVGVAAPFQLGGWHRMLGLTEAQSGPGTTSTWPSRCSR